MRKIPVYKGQRLYAWAKVSNEDFADLVQWKWTMTAGYPCRWDPTTKKAILMHREVMGLRPGDGQEVDHIDGDHFDNRREKLRVCTRAQQMQNVPARSGTSRFRGVSWSRTEKRWMAQARVSGLHFFRLFDDEIEAAKAAQKFRDERMPHARPDPELLKLQIQQQKGGDASGIAN